MRNYALFFLIIAGTIQTSFGVQFINTKGVAIPVFVYERDGKRWQPVTGFTLLAGATKYGSRKIIVAGKKYKVEYDDRSEEFTESIVYDKAKHTWKHIEIYVK